MSKYWTIIVGIKFQSAVKLQHIHSNISDDESNGQLKASIPVLFGKLVSDWQTILDFAVARYDASTGNNGTKQTQDILSQTYQC